MKPVAVEQTNDLKQIFFDEYEGFADKRIKNIESSSVFTIDDRGPKDTNAKNQLFSWFCQMSADIVDQDTVKIILRGGVPTSADVVKWLKAHGATSEPSRVEFLVKRGDQAEVASLAAAIWAITDGRYKEKSYKYVCPRVGESLDRLRAVLDRAWL
jgi:hypothetical protein